MAGRPFESWRFDAFAEPAPRVRALVQVQVRILQPQVMVLCGVGDGTRVKTGIDLLIWLSVGNL